MDFEFATAQRIVFGAGKLQELPALAAGLGKKTAFITGRNAERIGPVFQLLKEAGTCPAAFSISGEPTSGRIATLAAQAREQGCDHVVAFGGGSVIDAGKAIAALLTNTRDLMDYLEVIGKGEPLTEDPAPCIAIPTTAGTGAEVTRNSVLLSPEHKVKVSMRHPRMLPTVALVDPELTLSMPPEVTASTGLDAFIQLFEAFVSKKANPLTDGICREGLRRVSRSLYRCYIHGDDIAARTDMAFGSLCGGLALANAGLGAIHGFAGPLGGMFNVPHGMVCAALLQATTRTNYDAMIQRDPQNPALDKFHEAARIMMQDENATIEQALEHLKGIAAQMFVPGLSEYGVSESDIPAIVEKARNASSMKGNPIVLTDEELASILEESLAPPVDGDATLYL
ncbi:1,3-propanediol dehydrogenase [Pontiella desulfatans]|uniref:1,3-propanediol dehydrogenase n=1 Tax=Pontiella desulfatans TaxID=2750659 RepID=A0A6C2TWG9_PONDE|nr:iron-containing alcohol dehydrogenase [Pontiella desulfatans]VGO12025.1 1,3-propanediol dehydrogenase [Pontiella desulfatans]